MSGIIQFPEDITISLQMKQASMDSEYPKKKPPTPPRPDTKKRPKKLASVSSLDAEPKVSPGPEDFPRTLSLDLPPDERENNLTKFLCKKKLPKLIRLTEPFTVPGCSTALKADDVLLLHFIYDKPTVHATNSKGKNIRLPIYAEQKYEMLPLDPRLDDMFYSGTKALMDADPLPPRVRVVDAHCSINQGEDQEADEIIDLLGFEQDEERGRLLVGMSGDSPIKYSTELVTSRYTTMLSPDFHPMTEIIDHKFPQRIRIPDEKKRFSERNFKEEKVLNLKKFSVDKYVVATRADDCHIYSIPLTTPIKFAPDPIDQHTLDKTLPALYPLVNTGWGLIDPTQEALKTSMEAIPQPMEQVIKEWFGSLEGKERACEVAKQRVDDLKEDITVTLDEMRKVKEDAEFFKRSKSFSSDQDFPRRPPRTPPHSAKKLPGLPEEPPSLPPRPRRRSSDMSDSDDYESVDEVTNPFANMPKDTPTEVIVSVREILAKKERELKEMTQHVNFWKSKFEAMKKEKDDLKKAAPTQVYEELPDFPGPKSGPQGSVFDSENYLQPNLSTLRKSRPRDLRNYTIEQVCDFLRENELEKYIGTFRSNCIDGALLQALDNDHLVVELQMTRLHALRLKTLVDKLDLPPLPPS